MKSTENTPWCHLSILRHMQVLNKHGRENNMLHRLYQLENTDALVGTG